MTAVTASGLVKANGVTLYWASWGEGEPVVLFHGGAGHSDHWSNQVPALMAKFRVIVIDARGHGRSTRDTRPFTYAQMADDALAVLDELKVDTFSAAGWSDGGVIALDLAIRHPERVKRLFVLGTNFTVSGGKRGSSPALTAYFARCAADYAKLSPTPKGYEALLAALRPMWKSQPDYAPDQLSGLTAATVVADGAHDELIRQAHLEEMVKLIPKSRLLLIPHSSHLALWQQPAAVNEALLGWLAMEPAPGHR
ncbi:MAG: alpha/beta fold hydrolase [Myxococcaceae bacterium]|nr:alpha/beta fold hydrolase [Myxococcaceae bacterium]